MFPLGSFKTTKGNDVSIDDLKGKPTLINFWFTSCAPCVAEMPALNKLRAKYKESVNFISMASDSKEKVEAFLEKRTFNFIHIVAPDFIENDLKISSFPTNIFLDRHGRISRVCDGIPFVVGDKRAPSMGDSKEFELILDELLRQGN
jgi:thiol-disulfide isomerase/thioredoxin